MPKIVSDKYIYVPLHCSILCCFFLLFRKVLTWLGKAFCSVCFIPIYSTPSPSRSIEIYSFVYPLIAKFMKHICWAWKIKNWSKIFVEFLPAYQTDNIEAQIHTKNLDSILFQDSRSSFLSGSRNLTEIQINAKIMCKSSLTLMVGGWLCLHFFRLQFLHEK